MTPTFIIEPEFIPSNTVEYFNNTYGQSYIQAGRTVEKNDEIIICKTLVEKIGVFDENEIIGKQISFSNVTVGVDKFTVVGVFDERLKNMTDFDSDLVALAAFDSANCLSTLSVRNYSVAAGVVSKLKDFVGDEPAIFYFASHIADKLEFIESQSIVVSYFFATIAAIIIIAIILYGTGCQLYLANSNKTFYGILRSVGSSKKMLTALVFLEQMLVCVVSILISLGISYLAMIGISSALAGSAFIDIVVNASSWVYSILLSVFISIIYSTISVFTIKKIYINEKIIDLLKVSKA